MLYVNLFVKHKDFASYFISKLATIGCIQSMFTFTIGYFKSFIIYCKQTFHFITSYFYCEILCKLEILILYQRRSRLI